MLEKIMISKRCGRAARLVLFLLLCEASHAVGMKGDSLVGSTTIGKKVLRLPTSV